MEIVKAERGDLKIILEIQRRAFSEAAVRYNNDKLPPLTEKLEDIEKEFEQKIILKAVESGRIIGAVRGCEKKGICHISRLIVEPEYSGRGFGRSLLMEIEKSFADADEYELFTGNRSLRNIKFYENAGYKIFKEERVDDSHSMIFMKKIIR